MTTKTKLTPLQLEILMHRLVLVDALSEVYGETMADGVPDGEYDEARNHFAAEAGIACDRLLSQIERDGLPEKLEGVEAWVLADCINGSTWIGCMIDNESDQKIRAHVREGDKLAEIVREITGIPCRFPDC